MSARRTLQGLRKRVPLKRNCRGHRSARSHVARRETGAGEAHIILVVGHCCGRTSRSPGGCGRLSRRCADCVTAADRDGTAKAQRGRKSAGVREGVRVVEQLVDVRWPPRSSLADATTVSARDNVPLHRKWLPRPLTESPCAIRGAVLKGRGSRICS